MSARSTLPVAVVLLLLAASCSETASPRSDGQTSPSPSVTDSPTAETATGFGARMACSLPRQWLLRIYRGYDAERSAELQILPEVPNFVGSGLPHVGPWDFTSDVPMFWYGPGFIKPIGPVQEPVTSADIVGTLDHLL